ncbi:glycosyltransferase [Parapedobacter sp. ISTM3]|uniref:glycosyltransferase n=1 Tax=Parapedobacter sp. ISTM3 TaxID=2800130 RepID=UPI0019085A70|nr:glycosyltransferase [Parapedobacter sp. ISTM3]MBK1441653.1 glycosyltransferase [Parapedobacter sp. ISTM3]
MDTSRTEHPFVSIIIPTYDDWDRLRICLNALSAQTYDKNHFEVIVVNNKPQDSGLSFSTDFPWVKLITEHKPGSYAARNAGVRIAKGEILGFTDSDCVPDTSWIKEAVEFLKKEAHYDRVSGPIVIFTKDEASWIEFYDIFFAFDQETCVSKGYAVTAHMFSKKKVFETVGLYDDSLQSGGDAAWGKLADQNGFKIGFCKTSIMRHPARDSLAELVKKERRVGLGLSKVNKSSSSVKHKLRLLWYALKPKWDVIKYIFNKESDATFINRLVLCFLRYYLVIIRTFSIIKNS